MQLRDSGKSRIFFCHGWHGNHGLFFFHGWHRNHGLFATDDTDITDFFATEGTDFFLESNPVPSLWGRNVGKKTPQSRTRRGRDEIKLLLLRKAQSSIENPTKI